MAGLRGGVASFNAYERTETRRRAALFLIAGALLVGSAPALAGPQGKRTVLGTIVTAGTLEAEAEPGTWTPVKPGAPVLEATVLRTLGGERGLVALGVNGILGFRKPSHIRIGRIASNGLEVSLIGDSEVSFRLPTTTAIYFLTDSAIVRGPMSPIASGDDFAIQGVVRQSGQTTTVGIVEGDVRMQARDTTQFVRVGSGEEMVVAARGQMPRPAALSKKEKKQTRRRRLAALGFLGTKKGLLIAGGTLAAVGGGVGAAVAASDGDSSDDSASQGGGGGGPASPFKP